MRGERERAGKMGSMLKENEMERVEADSDSKEAILYVNGVRQVLPDGLAHFTLLEYLRGDRFFTCFPVFLFGVLASYTHCFV